MSDCALVDRVVTPYVDGELPAPEQSAVDDHLRGCPACRARVDAERSMHALLQARRSALCAVAAPPALRARCAARATPDLVTARPFWRRATPLAVAASILAAFSLLLMYRLTQAPVRLLAAELTTDHVKCFMLHGSPDRPPSPGEVEQTLAQGFGWHATLPAQPERAGLSLVAARPCLYAEGRVAHIMYRYEGRPVSVFMLPDRERAEQLVDVMGHHAVVWTAGGRTFVLIAREPPEVVDRIARFVHAGLR